MVRRTNRTLSKSPRPITCYAIIKNNKLSPLEIYADKEVEIGKGEKIVKVKITVENSL